jgi:hypothetical protein
MQFQGEAMTNTGNPVLYELAQTMAIEKRYLLAVALRKMAQEGYASLAEIDEVPDSILLTIPGIGAKRLDAVRRLTRTEWQPPSPEETRVASRFLTAARLALCFWDVGTLESLVRGSPPDLTDDHSVESRLAVKSFTAATQEALHFHTAEELIGILHWAKKGRNNR